MLLALGFMFLDSDFVESRRLYGQIEKNLEITLSNRPHLIDRENFGWAEEGGDISLLQLSRKDCLSVENIMNKEEKFDAKSERYKFFNKNNIFPKVLRTNYQVNSHGDITMYALDPVSCIVYRLYFYE